MAHLRQFIRQQERFPRSAKRARRKARQQTGARHERSRIQRQSSGAARSVRRKSAKQAAFERRLAADLQGVATPGLTRSQLQAGARQTERFGEGQAQLAQRQGRQDLRAVNQQLRETEAANLAEIVQRRIDNQVQREQERQQVAQELRQELNTGVKQAQGLMELHGTPVNEQQWELLVQKVAQSEGIGLVAARRAVKRVRRKGQDLDIPRLEALSESTLGPTGRLLNLGIGSALDQLR